MALAGCRINVDHVCKILDDVPDLNCKIMDQEGRILGRCDNLDNVILACQAGVCKNVSQIYDCQFRSRLDDIKEENDGLGRCFCSQCSSQVRQVRPALV